MRARAGPCPVALTYSTLLDLTRAAWDEFRAFVQEELDRKADEAAAGAARLARRDKLAPRRKAFAKSQGSRATLVPRFSTFADWPAVKPLWEPADAPPVSDEWWERVLPTVRLDFDAYLSELRVEAIRAILSATTGAPLDTLSTDAAAYPEDKYDEYWFERPSALFLGERNLGPSGRTEVVPLPFPETLAEHRAKTGDRKAWFAQHIDEHRVRLVRLILDAVGETEDSVTSRGLDAYGAGFVWLDAPYVQAKHRDRRYNWVELVRLSLSTSVCHRNQSIEGRSRLSPADLVSRRRNRSSPSSVAGQSCATSRRARTAPRSRFGRTRTPTLLRATTSAPRRDRSTATARGESADSEDRAAPAEEEEDERRSSLFALPRHQEACRGHERASALVCVLIACCDGKRPRRTQLEKVNREERSSRAAKDVHLAPLATLRFLTRASTASLASLHRRAMEAHSLERAAELGPSLVGSGSPPPPRPFSLTLTFGKMASPPAAEPAAKRQKTAEAPLPFHKTLLEPANVDRLRQAHEASTPYKHAVINQLFDEDFVKRARKEITEQLSFREKETDICAPLSSSSPFILPR